MQNERKSGKGCLIVAGVLLGVLAISALLGFLYARSLVTRFTDSKPIALPGGRLSPEQSQRLRERVERFNNAVLRGDSVSPLELNADEINDLIASSPELEPLRGKVYVIIEREQLKAMLSVPTEELGLRTPRGRYINAEGDFKVSLTNSVLQVNVESLTAKGKAFPENLMRQFRGRNLAQSANDDSETKAALAKLEDIRIEDGKLIIVPR